MSVQFAARRRVAAQNVAGKTFDAGRSVQKRPRDQCLFREFFVCSFPTRRFVAGVIYTKSQIRQFSVFFSSLSPQKDDRVCAQLFCFDAGSGYCVAYRPAAEGSPCGDGQVSRRYLSRLHDIDRKQLHTAIVVYSRPVSSSPVATLCSSRGRPSVFIIKGVDWGGGIAMPLTRYGFVRFAALYQRQVYNGTREHNTRLFAKHAGLPAPDG